MNYMLTNIEWAKDDWALADYMLPTEFSVSWENGCNTKEEAIDFVSAYHYDMLILSCDVVED